MSDPDWDFHEFYDELLYVKEQLDLIFPAFVGKDFENVESADLQMLRSQLGCLWSHLDSADSILVDLEAEKKTEVAESTTTTSSNYNDEDEIPF